MAETNNQPGTEQAPKKDRLGIYLDPDLLGRVRAAAPFAMAADRHNSLSEWLSAVLETEVRKIEKRFNDGEPFEHAEPYETLSRGPAVHPSRRKK